MVNPRLICLSCPDRYCLKLGYTYRTSLWKYWNENIMKATNIFIESGHPGIPETRTRHHHSRLKRISPFLLLIVFVSCWFLYLLITDVDTITPGKIVLLPFLIVNAILADFAVWNYFAGKKKWLIWIIEGILSAPIVYWFIWTCLTVLANRLPLINGT